MNLGTSQRPANRADRRRWAKCKHAHEDVKRLHDDVWEGVCSECGRVRGFRGQPVDPTLDS